MSHEELSFCELRNKEIVNEVDGRRLGKTCDMIFSPRSGFVLGIVAPFSKRGLFLKGQEVFIPFKHISKIGPDVILVRLTPELSQEAGCVNMGKKEKQGKFDVRRSAARNEREQGKYIHRDTGEYYPREDYEGESFRQERYERSYYGDENLERNPKEDNLSPDSAGAALPDCDFRCEKCMLFDCNKRWKGGSRQKKHSFEKEGGGSAYVDGKLYEVEN